MDEKFDEKIIERLCNKIDNDKLDEEFKLNELMESIKEKEKKYPRFKLCLTSDDIEKLDLIEDKLNPEIFTDNKLTPLEKLLLAILWKNGDYGKEEHIIKGIKYKSDDYNNKNGKFVFWNFGRYLNDKQLPIFDQHTKRAYIYLEQCSKTKESEVYTDYIKWFNDIISDFADNERDDAAYYLDSILFRYGKKLKKNK